MPDTEFKHDFLQVNGVELHSVTCGEKSDHDPTPILLLHGFPECWYSWRYLMPLLASGDSKGPREVVAIDMRGYNLSSKPEHVRDYRVPILCQDVIEVIKKISGTGEVYLVGHDWGGAIAWEMARHHPQYVKKLFIMNCPPQEVLLKGILTIPKQFFQSYYIFMFQIPYLPELLFTRKDCALIRWYYQGSRRPKGSTSRRRSLLNLPFFSSGGIRGPGRARLTDEEVEYYVNAFNRPGGMSGVNYYRAATRSSFSGGGNVKRPKVSCFTKVIWGVRDHALNVRLTYKFKDLVEPGKLEIKYIPKATHNVQQNCPEICAEEILKHLD